MDARQCQTLSPQLLAGLALHLRKKGSKLSLAQAASAAVEAWIEADTAAQSPAADPAPTQGYQWKSLFLPAGTELRMSTRESSYYARVVGDDIIFQGQRVSPRGMTLAIIGDGRNAWRDLWLLLPGERYWKQACRCRGEHQRSVAGLPLRPAAELIASNLKQLADDQAAKQAARQSATPAPSTAAEPGTGQAASQDSASVRAQVGASPTPAAAGHHADTALDTAGDLTARTQDVTHIPHSVKEQSVRPSATPAEAVALAAASMTESLKTMLALMERLSDGPFHDEERRLQRGRREEDILADQCAFD